MLSKPIQRDQELGLTKPTGRILKRRPVLLSLESNLIGSDVDYQPDVGRDSLPQRVSLVRDRDGDDLLDALLDLMAYRHRSHHVVILPS